jgi:hypothetical protein
MQDIKIWWVKLNARDELVFKVTVKAGDYSPVELQLMKNAEVNWDLLDINFTWLTSWDEEKNRKEKVQKLVFLMQTYCEKSNTSMDDEKNKLYDSNKLKIRSELNWSQLDYEIDLYKNWLIEFN